MKNVWNLAGVAATLLAGAPWAAWAQLPAVPAGPAGPVVPSAGAGVAAPGAAGPQRNLWSFLCLTEAQKAQCKALFCGSQFGQLLNNSLAPASALTGGVIPQCCPGPVGDPANLLRPPTSALGAAGRIQADTAAAAARRAAVRYLSTVDCNYWPEARAALIGSLRADRNECVRLEAALALQRGCCCNKDTIKALVLTVSGGRDDDNPAEDSPRVRAAAMAALEHCLCCYVSIVPAPPPPPPLLIPRRENAPAILPPPDVLPPPPPPGAEPQLRPASYYERVQNLSIQQVVLEGRQVLQRAKAAQTAAVASSVLRERSLSEVFENAFHPPKPPVAAPRGAAAPRALPTNTILAEPPLLKPVSSAAPQEPSMASSPGVVPPAQPLSAGTAPYAAAAIAQQPIVSQPDSSQSEGADPSRLLLMLRSSINPNIREWAARNLASRGEAAPSVVQALASSADRDASADVQLACLIGLLKLHVEDPALMATASRLRGASDPRVREAADTLELWLKSKSSVPTVARQ